MKQSPSPAVSIVNTLAIPNAHFGGLRSVCVFYSGLLSILISANKVRRKAITSNSDRHDAV